MECMTSVLCVLIKFLQDSTNHETMCAYFQWAHRYNTGNVTGSFIEFCYHEPHQFIIHFAEHMENFSSGTLLDTFAWPSIVFVAGPQGWEGGQGSRGRSWTSGTLGRSSAVALSQGCMKQNLSTYVPECSAFKYHAEPKHIWLQSSRLDEECFYARFSLTFDIFTLCFCSVCS